MGKRLIWTHVEPFSSQEGCLGEEGDPTGESEWWKGLPDNQGQGGSPLAKGPRSSSWWSPAGASRGPGSAHKVVTWENLLGLQASEPTQDGSRLQLSDNHPFCTPSSSTTPQPPACSWPNMTVWINLLGCTFFMSEFPSGLLPTGREKASPLSRG